MRHSSLQVAAFLLLLFLFQTSVSQIKSDTLSVHITKIYEENSNGKFIEKTISNYSVKTSEITDTNLAIPQVLLSNRRIKDRAKKIMDSSAINDTILVFKQDIVIPAYEIWKSPKQICDVYRWDKKKWSLEKDVIISLAPTFEKYFWFIFVISLIGLPFVGLILFYGFHKEDESLLAHIVFQTIAGWGTGYFYFMYEKNVSDYIVSLSWLKITTINYIILFVGGWTLYKFFLSEKNKKTISISKVTKNVQLKKLNVLFLILG